VIIYYLLVFIMPLTSHRIWGRFVGDLTVTKYLGGACLIYACFHIFIRGRLPKGLETWQAGLFLLFYTIAAVSYFTLSLPSTSWDLSPFISYTSFLLFFFATASLVDSKARLRSVLLVAIAAAAFASLYVVREWQQFHNLIPDFRPGWVMGDSNYYTLAALPWVPIAFCLMNELRSVWMKLFCLGNLFVILCGVMLAASRGGFLGLLAASLIVVWEYRRHLRIIVLATAFLIPLCVIVPTSPMHRLLHPNYSDVEAVDNRTVAWKAGLRMIRAHPFIGVGLGNFKTIVGQYEIEGPKVVSIAHNTYIEIAAELGLPALLVFCSILFSSFRSLQRTRRRAIEAGSSLVYQAATGLEAGLLGIAVSIFFVSGEYQRSLWMVIFLSACLPSLARVKVRRKVELVGVNQERVLVDNAGFEVPELQEV